VTREKLSKLLNEYGSVALWTYLVIWLLTLAGFATAISLGVQIESASGGIGLLGMSWVATKLTQPLRIGGTLLLTPLVAAGLRRFRHRAQEQPPTAPRSGV
jgi:hypothetical protein